MRLKSVLFLAGYTARSQAYAQAMAHSELVPEHTVFFGTNRGSMLGRSKVDLRRPKVSGLFAVNFSESLKDTAERCSWNVRYLSAVDINDPSIFNVILSLKPNLIIYSGYGGQIVGERLINTAVPFLHIHSGWLPGYKGSTTLYYSWLKENFCGVSALILKKNIDEGPVIAKKRFPPPPKGIDPDYIYDSLIRADLLVSVLKKYGREEKIPKPVSQRGRGRKYFVIHPVLKHLARLRGAA